MIEDYKCVCVCVCGGGGGAGGNNPEAQIKKKSVPIHHDKDHLPQMHLLQISARSNLQEYSKLSITPPLGLPKVVLNSISKTTLLNLTFDTYFPFVFYTQRTCFNRPPLLFLNINFGQSFTEYGLKIGIILYDSPYMIFSLKFKFRTILPVISLKRFN